MTDPTMPPLELILRQVAAVSPEPWYPKSFAAATGIDRNSLDPYLDRLRMAGLIRLTDWVQGHGQGYILTPDGNRVLGSPRELARVQSGQLPAAREELEEGTPRQSGMTRYERGEAIRAALLRPQQPTVTLLLIAANVAVFIAGAALAQRAGNLNDYLSGTGGINVLLKMGALRNLDVAAGEWWRLFTCCFLHFGFLHLLMNMIGLYMIGPMVERMFGHWRYLLLYLIAGFGGSCAMCVSLVVSPMTPGAGASGAIWGLMTSMVAWVLLNRGHLPPQLSSSWLRQLGSVLLLNLFISFMPGISAAGHFGGGAVGFVVAGLLNSQRFSGSIVVRTLALLLVLACPVALVAAIPRAQTAYLRFRMGDERAQRILADRERVLFRDTCLARAAPLEKQARDVYLGGVKDLVTMGWQRRDPAAVRKAIDQLAEAIPKQRAALAIVDSAGPYVTEIAEKDRSNARAYLDAQLRMMELARRCLEAGEAWTQQEERELVQASDDSFKGRGRWRALLE